MNTRRYPAHLFIATSGVGVLLLFWMLVVLVDLMNVAGLGDVWYEHMAPDYRDRAWMWRFLFCEGSPAEIMQWFLLACAAGFAFVSTGQRREVGAGVNDQEMRFWLLMGIAFLLLLVEDAGNLRARVADHAGYLMGPATRGGAELAVFFVLAALPVSALVMHLRVALTNHVGRWYLLAGFALYGIGGGASASRYLWYDQAGTWLYTSVFRGQLGGEAWGQHSHGFWIMDYLVEESIELLAATCMAAAACAFATAESRGKKFRQNDNRDEVLQGSAE